MHGCGLNSYESQINWTATAFPRKLGSHYKGSVGPQHDTEVSHTFLKEPYQLLQKRTR